jgi:hypothetical protein
MTLELETGGLRHVPKLQRGLACIKKAMQLFRKRKRKTGALRGDSGEDE